MIYIRDKERIYTLKASMKTLLQMEAFGIQSELETGEISGIGIKLLFDLFHLFLCAGEKRSYTYSESIKIFDSLEEYNGAEKVMEAVEKAFNEALVLDEKKEETQDKKTEETEKKERLDAHLMIVQLSAIWGIPAEEIYNMTPKEIATYRESFNSNLSQVYDTYRFVVFESVRNALSDKVKNFKPLFAVKEEDEKQSAPTMEELKRLKEFTTRKK